LLFITYLSLKTTLITIQLNATNPVIKLVIMYRYSSIYQYHRKVFCTDFIREAIKLQFLF